jgi:hypothetical protein
MRLLAIVIPGLLGVALLLNGAEAANPSSIVRSAGEQIGRTLRYDPDYRGLDHSNGDLSIPIGIADVPFRALRVIDAGRLLQSVSAINWPVCDLATLQTPTAMFNAVLYGPARRAAWRTRPFGPFGASLVYTPVT